MKHLEIKWTISRARDTEGYNVITLIDGTKKYRAMGGGYDMQGTVIGQWIQINYQDRLRELTPYKEGSSEGSYEARNYGLSRSLDDKERFYLSGACGLDCMLRIGNKIGLKFQRLCKGRKNELIGFIVTDDRGE